MTNTKRPPNGRLFCCLVSSYASLSGGEVKQIPKHRDMSVRKLISLVLLAAALLFVAIPLWWISNATPRLTQDDLSDFLDSPLSLDGTVLAAWRPDGEVLCVIPEYVLVSDLLAEYDLTVERDWTVPELETAFLLFADETLVAAGSRFGDAEGRKILVSEIGCFELDRSRFKVWVEETLNLDTPRVRVEFVQVQ